METRPTWLTGVAVVLLCQIGCAGEGSGPAPSDEDVVTVLSASPRLGPSGWGLSPEPIMQLGRVEGGGADLFDQVGDLLVLPDGTLLVANRGDNTIRFFQADGEFVRSIGGTGDGPGEFRFLAGVESLGDEILGIPFFLTRPVQVFDMQGDYIRTIRASLPADNPALTMQGTFSDGSLLAVRIPQGRPVEEGLYTQQSEIYLLDPAAVVSGHKSKSDNWL